jgi:hypothetical protein
MAIAEDLDFNVARSFDVALQVDAGVTEVRDAHASDSIVVFCQFHRIAAHAHADAAASSGAFQYHGISAPFGFDECVLLTVEQACSRQKGRSVAERNFARCMFQSKGAHLRRRWTKKHDAGAFTCRREIGILAEKPIARMNRFGSMLSCRIKDGVLVQIARRRRRPGILLSDWAT